MPDNPTYKELQANVRTLEARLAEQNAIANRYRSLFENLLYEVHIWQVVRDESGKINNWRLVDANPAALNLWGKTSKEVVGKLTSDIFPDANTTEQFLPLVEDIFSNNIPHTWEKSVSANGQTLPMISIPVDDYFVCIGMAIDEPVTASPNLTAPVDKETATGSKTILVVDDESLIREMLETLLEMMGHKILSAKDGREAVEIYSEYGQEIDLVILDMNMPIMAGSATFYAIRELNPLARVLVATGYNAEHSTSKLLSDGAIGVLQKPYKLAELKAIIQTYTG